MPRSAYINDILAPFARLANKHALSNMYRALYIDAESIVGASPWGMLQAQITGIAETDPFWIDAANFIAVCKSMPNDDAEFVVKNGLSWSCGMAEGKLALFTDLEFKPIEWPDFKHAWEPDKSFADALLLGAISCGSSAMASAGIAGVEIRNTGDEIQVLSSDDITISRCAAGKTVDSFPDRITLGENAAQMLTSILKTATDKNPAKVWIDDKTIYIKSSVYRLMLKLAPVLKHDLLELTDKFASHELTAQIPKERIAAFVKRATALAEAKAHTYVTLKAAQDGLALSFAEGTAASDEYYLVDGLDIPKDLPEIRLDASRVARVLSHADKLALDHLARGVLVFFGTKPNFSYMISGAQGA